MTNTEETTQRRPPLKAVVTYGTIDDLGPYASEKGREIARNEGPNQQPKDDIQLGDIDPVTATRLKIGVTRTRDHKGFTLVRETKYGSWKCLELPQLGSFTTERDIKKGVEEYLNRQEKKEGDAALAARVAKPHEVL